MVKIKICGLSRLCDIEAVNDAKPEYIGFVFAESRRRVTPQQAEALRTSLSPLIIPVGIFVNERIDNIMSLVHSGVIETIQLHGNETEEYISKIKKLTKKPVIKAISVAHEGDAQKWDDSCADYLLLDNKNGGTGKVFDWELVGNAQKPFFLAGGLNIKNIEAAITKTGPFAVDVSSGVETGGFKDSKKIQAIVRRIRKDRKSVV